MARHVCNGAMLRCTFGMAPSSLLVLPADRVMTSSQPAATVMDFLPLGNIQPFGLCTSPSNPQVAAATAAALGVLTPMPCLPVTVAPWTPGAVTVTLGAKPSLDDRCTLTCAWGGIISVLSPGQFTHAIP